MRSSPPPFLLEESTSSACDLPTLASIVARKRRFSYSDALSSDPLFSDDVSDEEKRDGQPRKKLVRVPWWELQQRHLEPIAQPPKRRTRFRGVDSGVWMGSDESMISMDDICAPMQLETSFESEPPTAAAQAIVQQCLEDGDEVVDLSSIRLGQLDYAILQPLEILVPAPLMDGVRPPSEDQYGPWRPALQLYLSNGGLLSIPDEICRLPISVLSLRNNALSVLPSNIGDIAYFKELNVAGNQLKWLPWSLHGAGSRPSTSITIRPNPFLSIMPHCQAQIDVYRARAIAAFEHEHSQSKMRSPQERSPSAMPSNGSWSHRRAIEIFLVGSRVTYFSVSGRAIIPSQVREEDRYAPVDSARNNYESQTIHSLFELALQRTQRAQLHEDTAQLLPQRAPGDVVAALARASHDLIAGSEKCSTCGRRVIIHRAEWMEYWFHGHSGDDVNDDTVTPYLRKACSAACAMPTVATDYRSEG